MDRKEGKAQDGRVYAGEKNILPGLTHCDVREVSETPFFAPWISSSARLPFSPVSFLLLLPWFHLPSK
jgi:hypothetical protein